MPVTRNRGARWGKATQENLTICGGPSRTRSQRWRQQLLNGNEDDVALADEEREQLEAEADNQWD